MAAYAHTTTLDRPHATKVGREGLGMLTGKSDVTNYNATRPANTTITDQFVTINRVVVDGVSDNGYLVRWNPTDKQFMAYHMGTTGATVATDRFLVAASDDEDIGEFNWIAIGLV